MIASGAVLGRHHIGVHPERRSTSCRRPAGYLATALVLASFGPSRTGHAQERPSAPSTFELGEWKLAPEAELRVRGEYRRDPPDMGGYDLHGNFRSRVRDAWTVAERVRLGVRGEREALAWKVTLQDARALGSSAGAAFDPANGSSSLGALALYEMYGEVHGKGERPAYLRAGRQAVVWGEGRLVGAADFSPTGRSLDALRGHLAFGRLEVEAMGAILEAPSPLGAAFSDTRGPARSGTQLYGALGRWTSSPLLRVELYALARISRSLSSTDGSRFQAARLEGETYTGAVRVAGDDEGWDYGLEGAYQLGRSASLVAGEDVSIAAFASSVHVAKEFGALSLRPTVRASASYASGDDGGSTYRQFDPILPDPQRFHGAMDLFAWSNLFDAAVRGLVRPTRDVDVGLGYRYARLAQTSGEWMGSYLSAVGRAQPGPAFVAAGFVPGARPSDGSLGHEVDLGVTYRPFASLELRASWSGLLLGDAARAVMSASARGATQSDGTVLAPKVALYTYLQAKLAFP